MNVTGLIGLSGHYNQNIKTLVQEMFDYTIDNVSQNLEF